MHQTTQRNSIASNPSRNIVNQRQPLKAKANSRVATSSKVRTIASPVDAAPQRKVNQPNSKPINQKPVAQKPVAQKPVAQKKIDQKQVSQTRGNSQICTTTVKPSPFQPSHQVELLHLQAEIDALMVTLQAAGTR